MGTPGQLSRYLIGDFCWVQFRGDLERWRWLVECKPRTYEPEFAASIKTSDLPPRVHASVTRRLSPASIASRLSKSSTA